MNALGVSGEEMACAFLTARGHRVLERNWRGGHREIDLITRDAEGIHFVEVKARSRAEDLVGAIDAKKIKNLTKAAKKFLSSAGKRGEWSGEECFFDAVLIARGEEPVYYSQAFLPF